MANDYRALQAQFVDEFGQIGGMYGDAVALLWLVAVAAPAQVVGEHAMIASQFIGESLETVGVGGDAMYEDDRRSLFSPLDIVEGQVTGNNIVILNGFHEFCLHPQLPEILSTWRLSPQSTENPLHIAAEASARPFSVCVRRPLSTAHPE